MNIYYVNRYSKYKGPFDIIDSSREHIIKVGDICLRDFAEGVAFFVVYSSENTWNACKRVGIGDNSDLSDIGNTLLFSFDGLHKRRGNVSLIKQLSDCYREKVIVDFFNNATDILEYKRDLWDVALFSQFFASSQELIDRREVVKPIASPDPNKYPSAFAKYLDDELLKLLNASLNEGNGLKGAYTILRDKHPEMFRKALMKFLTENPGGTIYDRYADAFVTTEIDVETPKVTYQDDKPLEIEETIEEEPLKASERIDRYLIEIGHRIFLSIDEEIELAQKIRRGDIDARNKLVTANMRFVVEFVEQYLHKGLEFEDLLHEGFMGLIKASECFDETRGFKFISYASWWIRRYLTNAIVKDSFLIKFPLSVQILHRKVWDFKIRYEQQNGFMPSISEIEIEDEDNLERISFLDSLPNNLKNTCIPCDDLDIFEAYHNDIWDYENNEDVSIYVRSLLNRLSKRERNILIRVYGIGVREETLEIIGESHGLTRERVRQIKEKAIKKLRDMVFASSAESQLSGAQSTTETESTNHDITAKKPIETKTLKEVKKVYLQINSAQPAEAQSSVFAGYDSVILPSVMSDASSKDDELDTSIYTVVNSEGNCKIYNHSKNLIYSSIGSVKVINKSYYRVSLTHFFFTIGLIKRNHEGKFYNGAVILLANRQSKLLHKLNCKGFIELIEDIELNGRRRVKVDGCWFDELGNEVSEGTNTNSNVTEYYEVKQEPVEVYNTRKPEITNEIDKSDVEHIPFDSFTSFNNEEVEVGQASKDIATDGGGLLPIWTYAENIQFPKRSKQFLKCKCCVGLSMTGYYLIINHRFIKLGDYPNSYVCNVGNIWIKRPLDDRGYRMIHDNGKGNHLIGYAVEKGEKVVFTTPENDVYSVTFDGRIISDVKNKEITPTKDVDKDKLLHAFDKKATSYKYFWLISIVSLAKKNGELTIPFKEIAIRMAALAWPIVFEDEIDLGSSDLMKKYLEDVVRNTSLIKAASCKVVESYLTQNYSSQRIDKMLAPLLKNVPYRFLSPWIKYTTDQEVVEKSCSEETDCLYALYSDHIVINDAWWEYIDAHFQEICDFTLQSFISYAKKYNNDLKLVKLMTTGWQLINKE